MGDPLPGYDLLCLPQEQWMQVLEHVIPAVPYAYERVRTDVCQKHNGENPETAQMRPLIADTLL